MIALKYKDENEYKLINTIDTIILNNNLKVEDIDDLYQKCLEFYRENHKQEEIFSINIEGFDFVNPKETEFNEKLEDFIIKTLNEKGRL